MSYSILNNGESGGTLQIAQKLVNGGYRLSGTKAAQRTVQIHYGWDMFGKLLSCESNFSE